MALHFELERRLPGTLARAGRLTLPHGVVETPVFMPVGTKATVKALTPEDLEAVGAQIILGNAYHLYLRPGAELVASFGGLHGFSGWHRPFLTDSGGFQVFSLGFGLEHGVGKIAKMFPAEGGEQPARGGRKADAPREKLCKVDEGGVAFRSHLDGSRHRFTPAVSIDIQQKLGADIILAFDECTSPLAGHAYTRQALGRTHRWARESLEAWTNPDQSLFGIVQGGAYEDLRRESAAYINGLATPDHPGFPGFAIGGSLGESKADMHRILEWVCPLLDEHKPRHLLGIGEPEDLFMCIERGADMFDCVGPTRIARHGGLYTHDGKLSIRNLKHREDRGPIEAGCACYTCQKYSRGYLRHLFLADELLFHRLASIHNLHFIVGLTRRIRQSLLDGDFFAFKAAFLARYAAGRSGAPLV
ncbi:MAG: tRNA guanosine(34) transglycosylase Tgt [Candidatus Sericytochromatia bacterium]|nr:tRNA guanosine(34) transglycosylase Tgt [Candidatus Sericytochromatia bacterium]